SPPDPEPVDIPAGPAYVPPAKAAGARGGIGRRARFRSVFRKEWWFDSTRAHHRSPQMAETLKTSLARHTNQVLIGAQTLLQRRKYSYVFRRRVPAHSSAHYRSSNPV